MFSRNISGGKRSNILKSKTYVNPLISGRIVDMLWKNFIKMGRGRETDQYIAGARQRGMQWKGRIAEVCFLRQQERAGGILKKDATVICARHKWRATQ